MPGKVPIIVVFLSGFTLGTVFFGGLWLTVRALPKSRYPTLLAIGSLWGRTAVVLVGFLYAIDSRWQFALASLMGFIAARLVLGRWLPHGAAARRSAG